MSQSNMSDGLSPEKLSDSIFENEGARNCLIPMGLTSENVVEKYPELAGAVALAAAFDKKAEADGLSPEQRAIGAERTRQNIANRIERGDIPDIKIKAEVEVEISRQEETELSR